MRVYKVFVNGKFPFVIARFFDKEIAESVLNELTSRRTAAESPVDIEEVDVKGIPKELEEACALLHSCLEWDNGGERDYSKIIDFLNRIENPPAEREVKQEIVMNCPNCGTSLSKQFFNKAIYDEKQVRGQSFQNKWVIGCPACNQKFLIESMVKVENVT